MFGVEVDWNKVLVPILTAAVGGIVAWLATSGRRAIKNFGKTEIDIACDDLERALLDLTNAQATPDTADDEKAKEKVEAARKRVKAVQRLKGILDAFGAEEPSE
jgi:hypothetical protein